MPYVKTTTTGTNGNVTTTVSGGQVGSSSQTDSAALQAIAKGVSEMGKGMDLSTVNKNTGDTAANTKGILDKLNAYLGDAPTLDGQSQNSSVDAAVNADKQTAVDALSLSANPDVFNNLTGIPSDFFPGMLPSVSGCSAQSGIHARIFGKWDFDFEPCAKLQPLRELLAWVFSVLSMIYILKITFGGQT
ncbi:hypothetical protein C2U68_17070 [Methylomonas koyamae]|nr:hypothetical protein C2U68_17070 [Methylomonas koyamae]